MVSAAAAAAAVAAAIYSILRIKYIKIVTQVHAAEDNVSNHPNYYTLFILLTEREIYLATPIKEKNEEEIIRRSEGRDVNVFFKCDIVICGTSCIGAKKNLYC